MHLTMRQMQLQGIGSTQRAGAAQSVREAALATDRLALGAIVRQNIGMTEDDREKMQ
jgi:hypothetical protein